MTASVLFLAALATSSAPPAAGVPRAECFPVERLAPELRREAEEILLRALDGEALYTLVGGLKPASSGWFSTRIEVKEPGATPPDLSAIRRAREIAGVLRSGDEIGAAILPFHATFESKRFLDGFLYHRASVAATVERKASFFAYYGVTPNTPPSEVILAFESDPDPRRNRGYGYLFGYPDHAVDFFVESEESRRKDGKFVARDFLSIETFREPKHAFVYAVPKGHAPNEADQALKDQAAPILDYYRELRPKFIGPGKPGPVALLRAWYDDGRGRFSAETARKKATEAARKKAAERAA